MSFRTVVISKRCKLDLRMNYMEVRSESTKKVLLDDIDTLIVENPAVSITGCLMSALVEKKIKVIFCNSKENPQFELTPYYGSHDCSKKVREQVVWEEQIKGELWTLIVSEKIAKQADLLAELGHLEEEQMLRGYMDELVFMDATNREGHAAKVYFNAVFGMDFKRSDQSVTNAALNYGYSLLLSMVNREIVSNGYLTQLGIFHDNMFNQYNLSCDFMEPFRILVDRYVKEHNFQYFETEEKHEMLKLSEIEVMIHGTKQYLPNAIKIYVKSVLDALCEQDLSYVSFYDVIEAE